MKRNMVIGAICVILALVFAVNACDLTGGGNGNGSGGSDNGSGNNGNGENGGNGSGDGGNGGQGFLALAKADIVDATNLFIAPAAGAGNGGSGADEGDKLYKITDSGAVEEVQYYDEEDKEMPMEWEPSAVYNVNNQYTILVYSGRNVYLARKNDGAVFSLKDVGVPMPNSSYIENRKSIFTDSSDNIYYKTDANENVIKLNIQNPSNITAITYSPQADRVSGFIIDNTGNMIYFGRDSSNEEISRIKKIGGGLKNLESMEGRVAWIGPDNSFYYFAKDSIDQVKKYSSETDTITDFGSEINFHNAISSLKCWVLNTDNRVIICSAQNEVYEAYPSPGLIQSSTSTYPEYKALGLNSIKSANNSARHYYITGNDTSSNPVLLKVSVDNDTPVKLLSGYDIYKMTVTDDDIVVFNALRMSDGAIVIGEISAAGQVTILDAAINAEVTVLERIR
jgi:hypothetical protein